MVEKQWPLIGPVAVTVPGTSKGELTITSTLGFKVKMIVALTDPSLPPQKLEIKRVPSPTQLILGPPGKITDRADLTLYGATSFVVSAEQPRNSIPIQEIERATYEEEPTVAWRCMMVDPFGRYFSASNPLPVSLTGGATISANLEVQLTDKDNDPDPGDVHDAVRIGDGTDELDINPDGSINVNIVTMGGGAQEIITTYSEALSVVAAILTTIITYTVPVGKTAKLQRVAVNGENIADYTVIVNGTLTDRKRTYFSGPLNETFEFTGYPDGGVSLIAADTVIVKVIHNRPMSADFGARVQVLQIG